MTTHPRRRAWPSSDAVIVWLDEHPATSRLYCPVVVTLTLIVELLRGQ